MTRSGEVPFRVATRKRPLVCIAEKLDPFLSLIKGEFIGYNGNGDGFKSSCEMIRAVVRYRDVATGASPCAWWAWTAGFRLSACLSTRTQ
jgi:hypothetical protein